MPIQLAIFSSTVALGVVMGAFYDLFRTWHLLAHPRRWQIHLGDFIYWFITTLGVFFGLLLTNWGELRFFMLLGLALGAGLYFRWLSRWMLGLFTGIARLILRILAILILPLRWLRFVVRTLLKNFFPTLAQKEGIPETIDE
ncbi:MAG: spore cortex biosynthesis protein YabQ [Clostridia bacterium]|nr:spore cortex biosynthesis protein YabQ [Clostridia bacterium]